jgi:hypothetical protein
VRGSRGDEQDPVELEMLERRMRHREVRVVDRIERAAEDAYGSH